MKKTIGKVILFIVGIIFFGGILTWALLSANGKKLDINKIETNPIVQTGGIRINNDEYKNKLSVYIDGTQHEIKDNIIPNITPGEHNLTLSLEGYNSWDTTIQVTEGIIIDISPYLFPSGTLSPLPVTTTNIDKLFFSNTDDFAYFVVTKSPKGTENGIYKLKLSNENTIFNNAENKAYKISNITEELKPVLEKDDYKFNISPDNQRIIIESTDFPHFIISGENFTANSKEEPLDTLEKLIGFIPESYEWFSGSKSLIIKDKFLVAEVILDSKKIVTITYTPDKNPVFTVNGDTVLFYSTFTQSLNAYKNELTTEIVLENKTLPTNITSLIVDKESANFVVFETEGVYNYLDIKESYVDEIDSNITPISFAKDGKSLLYKKDNSIKTYTIREIKGINEYVSSINTILENYNAEVQTLKWNSRSTHLILLEKLENNVIQISVMDNNGENKFEIIKSDKIKTTNFHMLQDNKKLFLLFEDSGANETESAKNNLYGINLVAGTN